MVRRIGRLPVWAVLCAFLAACTGRSVPSASTSSSDLVAELSGLSSVQQRSFVASSVTGFDWPEGAPLTLTFFGPDQVSMHGTCNEIGGVLSWDGDTMVVDAYPITAAGCPADDLALDDWLTELLSARPVVSGEDGSVVIAANVRGHGVTVAFDKAS